VTEYTPSTDHVRNVYDLARLRWDGEKDGDLEFDRWLGEELAKAHSEGYLLGKCHGWDEGFDAGERDVMRHGTWDEPCIENPYREAEK
jgi:hypothetical protein